MNGSYAAFETFNRIEAAFWFATAVFLHFLLKPSHRRQRLSLIAASVGFILFGFTDVLEAPTHGNAPHWLWFLKITCAAFLLSCRFTYIGWEKFRFTDRWFLFGVCCLAVSVVLMVLG